MLKNVFDSSFLGYSIETYIPKENILYGFRISAGPENIEQCSQEFDKFLQNIEINYE